MPSKGRGVRLFLAKHLNCQTAYISQVLNQHVHFSLEQSAKVNSFLEHSRDEAKFFLLLVQYARAGSVELERFLEFELNEILVKRQDLANRINIEQNLDEINQHIYYSSWYYAAIHVILSIPGFQQPIPISSQLNLSIELVQEVLDFLIETGLAVLDGDKYKIGKTRIHLGKKSI